MSCSIWFAASSFWKGGGLKSRCVGLMYGADGARHHPHRTHDLQKTIFCNSPSNTPDDGRMYPKHVKLRIHP